MVGFKPSTVFSPKMEHLYQNMSEKHPEYLYILYHALGWCNKFEYIDLKKNAQNGQL